VVRVSQQVELRRNRAWDLHPGVGLMGEARLSAALERRINEAIENFLARVKEKLEDESKKEDRLHPEQLKTNSTFVFGVRRLVALFHA